MISAVTRCAAVVSICLAVIGCAHSPADRQSTCTAQSVGSENGSAIVTLTAMVPDEYIFGAEIGNGGIQLFGPKCDIPLNAYIADETARSLIADAKNFPLKYWDGAHVAEVKLFVWKFRDEKEREGFFVGSLMDVKPAQSLPAWWRSPNNR